MTWLHRLAWIAGSLLQPPNLSHYLRDAYNCATQTHSQDDHGAAVAVHAAPLAHGDGAIPALDAVGSCKGVPVLYRIPLLQQKR